MAWYYLPCGSCNKNGSFSNVNPNCSRCSGTGNDWDEGEDGRERLKSIYGKEPRSGKPPSQNLAGESVYSGDAGNQDSGSHRRSSGKKDSSNAIWIAIAVALVFVYLLNQPKKAAGTNSDDCPKTSTSGSAPTYCLKNIMAEPKR